MSRPSRRNLSPPNLGSRLTIGYIFGFVTALLVCHLVFSLPWFSALVICCSALLGAILANVAIKKMIKSRSSNVK